MRFPFGNKLPWSTVIEHKGIKKPEVLYGIPGDMEFKPYKDGESDDSQLTFLVGTKRGSRPLLIAVNPKTLEFALEDK